MLLYAPHGPVVYGFYDYPRWYFADEVEWSEAMQDDYCTLNSWQEGYGPTHWMPLPKPPVMS